MTMTDDERPDHPFTAPGGDGLQHAHGADEHGKNEHGKDDQQPVVPADAAEAEKLIRSYLQHHWVAARGGLDLFERASGGMSDPAHRERLTTLAAQVAGDRTALREIADRFGTPEATIWQKLTSLGETLARLKPNGSLTQRTTLTDLIELEGLMVAVEGKLRGWLTLRRLAQTEPRLEVARLDDLIQRADDQLEQLLEMHGEVADRLKV